MKAIFTPQSRQVLTPENKISRPAPLDHLSTIITSIRLHPSARTSTRREFVYPLRSYKPNWHRLPSLFWPTLEPPDQNDKIIAYSKHHEVEIIYWRSSPQTRVLFTSSFSICSLAFGYYTEVIMFICGVGIYIPFYVLTELKYEMLVVSKSCFEEIGCKGWSAALNLCVSIWNF